MFEIASGTSALAMTFFHTSLRASTFLIVIASEHRERGNLLHGAYTISKKKRLQKRFFLPNMPLFVNVVVFGNPCGDYLL